MCVCVCGFSKLCKPAPHRFGLWLCLSLSSSSSFKGPMVQFYIYISLTSALCAHCYI